MKGRISQGFFFGAIIILIGIICLYGIVSNNHTNIEDKTKTINKYYKFNNEERQYIKQHGYISIYIDKNLQYLMEGEDDGFLGEYLNSIFKPSTVKIRLTKKLSEADCQLMIINDRIRRENKNIDYTASVFQMNGAIFINQKTRKNKNLSGVVMDERLEEGKLKDLKYNGNALKFSKVDTAEEAVNAAISGKKDFIIGDRSAVLNALDGNKDYLALEDSIYSSNVCIITSKSDEALYGILNHCVYAADRHKLTYEIGQKWFDGNGPHYMDDSYEDIYMLVLIIFTAVLIAFFIYYQANRNLYHELNVRMEKLTESKQELKTTFNGVGYYLAEINLDGSILDINRAFYYFVKTDAVNKKIWEVMELDQNYKNKIQQKVETTGKDKKTKSIEVRLKKETLVIDIFPIRSVRGSVEKLLFMAMDVTHERMAERQLLQDNKMIAVGQLAAGVAHEIRNPLGIIRNYCYVLKNMDDESVKSKAIEQIEKAVDKSGAIINSLLNFSRVSTKQGETINVEEHIWSLVQLNNNIFKKKNINLEITSNEKVTTFIAVESLDMILINLISNATDAMNDSGKLTIRINKYRETFDIEVQDTGVGIEEDILQDIFNPFFTTKGNNKGNGLGLYIVYNEANKMNGTIEVESKLGEGSKFKLKLPLVETVAGKGENNG